jgi:hypothetical protein
MQRTGPDRRTARAGDTRPSPRRTPLWVVRAASAPSAKLKEVVVGELGSHPLWPTPSRHSCEERGAGSWPSTTRVFGRWRLAAGHSSSGDRGRRCRRRRRARPHPRGAPALAGRRARWAKSVSDRRIRCGENARVLAGAPPTPRPHDHALAVRHSCAWTTTMADPRRRLATARHMHALRDAGSNDALGGPRTAHGDHAASEVGHDRLARRPFAARRGDFTHPNGRGTGTRLGPPVPRLLQWGRVDLRGDLGGDALGGWRRATDNAQHSARFAHSGEPRGVSRRRVDRTDSTQPRSADAAGAARPQALVIFTVPSN